MVVIGIVDDVDDGRVGVGVDVGNGRLVVALILLWLYYTRYACLSGGRYVSLIRRRVPVHSWQGG